MPDTFIACFDITKCTAWPVNSRTMLGLYKASFSPYVLLGKRWPASTSSSIEVSNWIHAQPLDFFY